jgi:serine/threonine protein kinase
MIETGKLLQQRYRIEKQIGQGGMGAVYVATDERFGSTVAIKETLFMDDNYRKAIEREARLLNSLKHIALPRVTDHFLEENVQFLVMEYIAGEDLAHKLEESSMPFPVEQVLTWADQLLDALDFLHNQVNPVIHRDIKPQNLKVTPKGQIILLDFGLAKGNPTDAGHHTAAKSIFGYSRNYASLEQIQGTGTDPRSDLYSLAATLYHLLTNKPPEDALTRAMSVLSHQPDPLVPANRIVSEIPAGVAGVLQKALALNANQRPASASEMRAMLREPEQYADVVAAMPAPEPLYATEIHSARTKIMPGSTIHDAGRQTDVKTEVMPSDLSQLTALKSGGAQTASSSRRRFGLVAGALSALVLAGSVVGGVYLYDPALFNVDHEDQPVPTAEAPVVEEVQPAAVAPTTDGGAAANVESATANVNTTSTAVAKPTGPAKTARAQSSTNTGGKAEVRSDRVIVDGDTVYIGNTKITDDRVETPDRVIDGNGITPQRPRMQPIPPPDLRHLTPEQRRRVLRTLRRNGIIVARPTP